jgi:8-oxo-dGTP pyrophosphatase MutT (NUDIX family)
MDGGERQSQSQLVFFRVRKVAGCIPIILAPERNHPLRRLMSCPLGDTECLLRPDLTDSQLLLINSRKHPGKYVFPKGGLKHGEDPRKAAIRETFEETGCEGQVVGEFLGKHWSWYLLSVDQIHDEWKEKDQRERIWVHYDEALHVKPLTKSTRKLINHLYKTYPSADFEDEGSGDNGLHDSIHGSIRSA